MADRKAVSLSGELHLLIQTVDGVRDLADRLSLETLNDRTLPSSIAATLALLKERLRLLDRAVRGAVDPQVLWCRENDSLPPVPDGSDDGQDIVLRAWTDAKAAKRHRKAWKAARRRLKRSTEG